jgi:hypothetical protein
MTVIEQRTGDNAHRIREIDDPGVLGSEPGDSLSDL